MLPSLMLLRKIFLRIGRHGPYLVCQFATRFWFSGAGKRHDKSLPIHLTWNFKKETFLQKHVLKMSSLPCISGSVQPVAATRNHSQPFAAAGVAASGRSSQLQAGSCSSGLKWPPHIIPRERPQVAASGRSRTFRTSGCKWPLSAISISTPKATPLAEHVFPNLEEGNIAVGPAQRITCIWIERSGFGQSLCCEKIFVKLVDRTQAAKIFCRDRPLLLLSEEGQLPKPASWTQGCGCTWEWAGGWNKCALPGQKTTEPLLFGSVWVLPEHKDGPTWNFSQIYFLNSCALATCNSRSAKTSWPCRVTCRRHGLLPNPCLLVGFVAPILCRSGKPVVCFRPQKISVCRQASSTKHPVIHVKFTFLHPPSLSGWRLSAYSPPSTSVCVWGVLLWKAVRFPPVFPDSWATIFRWIGPHGSSPP